VAIRTFEVAGGRIRLGVGGGVVADSDPAAEAEELAVKAAPLLRAIGASPTPAPTRPRPRSLAPLLRAGPEPVPRPDPAAGVFETLRVADGRPVALEAHLARLAASARALYGLALPDGLAERAAAAATAPSAGASPDGRLRIDLRPDGTMTLATGPLPASDPLALRAWTVPGGLGPHKWADRRLVEALEAASDGAAVLLVDAGGAVLEAGRANVFARGSDGIVRTPPADGRILPGVHRARLLAEGAAIEAELSLDDLLAATDVWLTSALRSVPVTGIAAGDVALAR
jgi:para-aminobenzoate synthetase/4-amino-4-deoxychorismate lyase